ncbi:MAG: hypothetical protein ABGZ35_08620 [Planctomycetaceae bacterium]
MNEASRRFARLLSKNLAAEDFDLIALRDEHGVSVEDVMASACSVFERLCLRASSDGVVTEAERRTLDRCGTRLGLDAGEQKRILSSSKKQVFSVSLKRARDDGAITEEEAEELYQLRVTLGLPPVKIRQPRRALPPVVRRRKRKKKRTPIERLEAKNSTSKPDEQRRFRQDVLMLSVFAASCLCLAVGVAIAAFSEDGSSYKSAGVAIGGVSLIFVFACSLWIISKRLQCPECRDGKLRPVLKSNNTITTAHGNEHSTTYTTKLVPQFFDCDCCGYREWLEDPEGGTAHGVA